MNSQIRTPGEPKRSSATLFPYLKSPEGALRLLHYMENYDNLAKRPVLSFEAMDIPSQCYLLVINKHIQQCTDEFITIVSAFIFYYVVQC